MALGPQQQPALDFRATAKWGGRGRGIQLSGEVGVAQPPAQARDVIQGQRMLRVACQRRAIGGQRVGRPS